MSALAHFAASAVGFSPDQPAEFRFRHAVGLAGASLDAFPIAHDDPAARRLNQPAAFERMQRARTNDEVRLAIGEVMAHLRADPPAIFLAMPREARAADKSIKIPYEPDRDVFYTLWQLQPGQRAAAQSQ